MIQNRTLIKNNNDLNKIKIKKINSNKNNSNNNNNILKIRKKQWKK